MATTLIKNGTVVGYADGGHRILKNGQVAYEGDTITYVGPAFEGEADEVIDASGGMVIPGLISTHCHLRLNEGYRMVLDGGRRDLFKSGFLNYAGAVEGKGRNFIEGQQQSIGVAFAMMSLLRFGVTSIIELDGGGQDGGDTVLRMAGECGIRLFYSPFFSGANYRFLSNGRLEHVLDEKQGFEMLDRSTSFIEQNNGAFDDRFRGLLVLNEFYGSTPALRKEALSRARALGVKMTMHFAEHLYEFHDTIRHYGKTPVAVLADEGLLCDDVVLGHCKFISGDPSTNYPYAGDLELLGEAGMSIAHSPIAFARRGAKLESFDKYLKAGVNISLGTDSMPHDLIREMNVASIMGKVAENNNEAAQCRDIFNAATLGGARALGRPDLGRLAAGCKADIVVVDMDNLSIGPALDPIRMLVFAGDGALVRTTIVNGVTRVADGVPQFWDEEKVRADAVRAAEKTWSDYSKYDFAGRSVTEAYPPSFPDWG